MFSQLLFNCTSAVVVTTKNTSVQLYLDKAYQKNFVASSDVTGLC